MGDFIYFTEEQKERANAVPIMDILKREHEEVERSGNEWRWKRHGSVTFRGNRWYRHSQQMGSHAIDFMQEFFGMSYPEAVTYLLDGETAQVIHGGSPPRETTGKKSVRPKEEKTTEEKEPKVLIPPEKNDTMKRVYAYLMLSLSTRLTIQLLNMTMTKPTNDWYTPAADDILIFPCSSNARYRYVSITFVVGNNTPEFIGT